jgi:hypothetical protein
MSTRTAKAGLGRAAGGGERQIEHYIIDLYTVSHLRHSTLASQAVRLNGQIFGETDTLVHLWPL